LWLATSRIVMFEPGRELEVISLHDLQSGSEWRNLGLWAYLGVRNLPVDQ
jgi:hypothetical protein